MRWGQVVTSSKQDKDEHMRRLLTVVLAVNICARVVHAGWFKADVEPADLRCEYLGNPLGIDTLRPRLSWKLETGNLKPEN